MRLVGPPNDIPKELPVEFMAGPWDGVVLVLRMPPPAQACVGAGAPAHLLSGRPLRVDAPTDIAPGPHMYERELTSAGFVYHYQGVL